MRNRNIDMTKGKLLPGMFLYTLPILFSNILALLYHTADQIVVGQFSTHAAFAAVGSTGALSNLFTVLFYGISAGGCIVVAQYYGARDGKNVSETVHTCILVSIIGGVLVAVFALAGVAGAVIPLVSNFFDVALPHGRFVIPTLVALAVGMLVLALCVAAGKRLPGAMSTMCARSRHVTRNK